MPGGYETTATESGFNGNNPPATATIFTLGDNITILQANCGAPGDGGASTNQSTNTSNTSGGGSGSVNASNVSSAITIGGNTSNYGNNCAPGSGGKVGVSNNLPLFNLNGPDAPQGVSNQTGRSYNLDNELPGIGQGGWGGLNAQTNNGYAGQCGGRSYVRVYFLR